jgi:uncharacterized membrane protein YhaH (DUF805 family)
MLEGLSTKRVATALASMVLLSLLVYLYSPVSLEISFIWSLVYCSTVFTLLFLYSTFSKYVRRQRAIVAIAAASLVISLSVLYTLSSILSVAGKEDTLHILPLATLFGSLLWLLAVREQPKEAEPEQGKSDETLTRISVKEGSRIHIIKTEKIEYIQSYGDYVHIFSEGQKHIKELTMKYLESSLPIMFVRIHRSCIVNSSMISRIEHYGKESYNVHLKNGTCLKASATGYKSLKQFLSI